MNLVPLFTGKINEYYFSVTTIIFKVNLLCQLASSPLLINMRQQSKYGKNVLNFHTHKFLIQLHMQTAKTQIRRSLIRAYTVSHST